MTFNPWVTGAPTQHLPGRLISGFDDPVRIHVKKPRKKLNGTPQENLRTLTLRLKKRRHYIRTLDRVPFRGSRGTGCEPQAGRLTMAERIRRYRSALEQVNDARRQLLLPELPDDSSRLPWRGGSEGQT